MALWSSLFRNLESINLVSFCGQMYNTGSYHKDLLHQENDFWNSMVYMVYLKCCTGSWPHGCNIHSTCTWNYVKYINSAWCIICINQALFCGQIYNAGAYCGQIWKALSIFWQISKYMDTLKMYKIEANLWAWLDGLVFKSYTTIFKVPEKMPAWQFTSKFWFILWEDV